MVDPIETKSHVLLHSRVANWPTYIERMVAEMLEKLRVLLCARVVNENRYFEVTVASCQASVLVFWHRVAASSQTR